MQQHLIGWHIGIGHSCQRADKCACKRTQHTQSYCDFEVFKALFVMCAVSVAPTKNTHHTFSQKSIGPVCVRTITCTLCLARNIVMPEQNMCIMRIMHRIRCVSAYVRHIIWRLRPSRLAAATSPLSSFARARQYSRIVHFYIRQCTLQCPNSCLWPAHSILFRSSQINHMHTYASTFLHPSLGKERVPS